MRLFAALPLSPEGAEQLTNFRLRWSAPKDGLRWSTPEQWHITLRFFGDVDETQAQCLQQKLQQMKTVAPDLTLVGLELFAPKGILVVALHPSQALSELYAQVTAFIVPCGIAAESRPFNPHVTLARSKGKAGDATLQRLRRPALPKIGRPIHWIPGECLLLESVLRPQGAEYTIRSRVPLGTSQQIARSLDSCG